MDVRTTLLLAATTIAALVPATAAAQPASPEHDVFATSEVDTFHPSGQYAGTLDVYIFPNGNVSGYFRAADTPAEVTVTGDVTGKNIYLQIGNETPLYGNYENGKIEAYREGVRDRVRFTAVPGTP